METSTADDPSSASVTDLLKDWPKGEPVPAISIRQPWAAAVVWLGKDIENRNHWIYKYRGPLIIHASASKFSADDLIEMLAIARKDGVPEEELDLFNPDGYVTDLLAQGAIVGVAKLTAVFGEDDELPTDELVADSPWGEDTCEHWLHLTEATPCEPAPFKGRVGLFKVPYEIAMSLRPFDWGLRTEKDNSN